MCKKKVDVTAMGELLIDFTQNSISPQGNYLFEANPGGAPCNVLAMLTKLGKKTAFIGKVGHDKFGTLLKEKVEGLGIDTKGLILDMEIPTTLAFVHKDAEGDRDFSFYRNPGADMMLKESEINEKVISSSKIFHFGTLSMTDVDVRKATEKAVCIATYNNCIITFDPNLRLPLWKDITYAKEAISYGLSVCDIVKIADNEIEFMTGTKDYVEGVRRIRREYPNIKLILATLGEGGSYAFYNGLCIFKDAFLNDETIETTGAGDTFNAIAISFCLDYGLDKLDAEKLNVLLTYANAGASLITTKRGALCVMPTMDEIKTYISKHVSISKRAILD